MDPITINKDICIGCGMCMKDCVSGCIEIQDGKAVYANAGCIRCGHCFAVCPIKAIDMTEYDTSACHDIVSMEEFDSEKLLRAMRSRRTTRQYKDIPVEQHKIDMILEAGRYCQTAVNRQNLCFTVLGSKQDEIEKACVRLFRGAAQAGGIFSKLLRNYRIDDHFFFKGAPLVIVVSGKGTMNRGLAESYMELMADSLGLGCLISGFTETCFNIMPWLKRKLELPKGHKIHCVMIIGYPDVKYQRSVPRKPVNSKTL